MEVKKSAIEFLINKAFAFALLFLIVQQLIVASSTYWIAGLAKQVSANENFTLYLVLFILSLTLVYIPSSLAAVFLEKSKFLALEKYVERFRLNFWNRASIRTSKEFKDYHLPYVSSEGFLVFNESSKFIFDWASVVLNVSLNVLALSLVLDTSIAWSYLVGLAFVSSVIFFFRKRIHVKGAEAQSARTALQRVLSLAWDNFLLGNKYNQSLYQSELKVRQSLALGTAVRSQYWNNLASALGMLLMMAPVLVWTSVLFLENMDNPSVLTVLVATLPRQVLILQHAYVVIFYSTSWSALSARLKGLGQAAETPKTSQNLEERIQWNRLKYETHGTLPDLASLKELIIKPVPSSGRITIRGPNGVGKSTFLCWLKEQLGESAYYLPAHHELVFEKTNERNLSTGQELREFLKEISVKAVDKIEILMLDEWDANLDLQSRQVFSKLIDKLSESLLIVEVRHNV
ncbi:MULTISPECIES: ATP-binding cassette domain-containing protein [Photorhabdus]|uniref:Photorhabdus luminescens subsp. laumondii TTO1 complete genome segment 8/17 n=2 Tax=Photorhabdus TaxID=29487 RepID=Q7N4U9_PHOLL|nr:MULTISPECIES: ABC transporter ATP-binding protein [Photorhabdus]AWK41996.1 hypothetical protein A4R40_11105 [Photorhabdus laumondii subsp. laumondii]AXG47319.1 hypothetical protein PluTT01m_11430 [Photorhabdus laumondii subsp. laumondii]MCC8376589.1 hypothetical protein [Photorhabdus bodei]MCT8352388.1 ABC transporter ATP-binding protein [Photorhabdus kayaii]MDB6368802.1 ABC transporter ATP-binding protein [Photorhabdus bodei]